MTHWNKYGSPLIIIPYYSVSKFQKFLGKLPGNIDDEPLWSIDEEGEILPISYPTEVPFKYFSQYIDIIKWMKENSMNYESGYAFTYEGKEDNDFDDRSVGGINSNNEGITFIELCGNGNIIQRFHNFN